MRSTLFNKLISRRLFSVLPFFYQKFALIILASAPLGILRFYNTLSTKAFLVVRPNSHPHDQKQLQNLINNEKISHYRLEYREDACQNPIGRLTSLLCV